MQDVVFNISTNTMAPDKIIAMALPLSLQSRKGCLSRFFQQVCSMECLHEFENLAHADLKNSTLVRQRKDTGIWKYRWYNWTFTISCITSCSRKKVSSSCFCGVYSQPGQLCFIQMLTTRCAGSAVVIKAQRKCGNWHSHILCQFTISSSPITLSLPKHQPILALCICDFQATK